MIELKEYQKSIISSLKMQIEKDIKSSAGKSIVFQSPTGSGKTFMLSQLLKDISQNREDNKKLSFIWISVLMLHEQSKEKLEKYYEDDQILRCSYFENLVDKKIGENEILFVNWSSINKKDIALIIKENEQDNNLSNVIENTKKEGRQIILIIDESGIYADSDKSKDLIDIISPQITIEVSATPHPKSGSTVLMVDLEEVIREEMIKNEIVINPDFLTAILDDNTPDEFIISQALKKREELLALYKKEGTNINPLLLIQLPDKKGDVKDKKDKIIDILEEKYNITKENGKLAIWLSDKDDKINLDNIEKQDDKAEVLIFKQAISIGWDCPRASILVIFRDTKSKDFTIQTVGRIMRMPEFKYYRSEELNKGYIFTNLCPNITEQYAKEYISIYESKRDATLYNDISLFASYIKRQIERNRLNRGFSKIFLKITKDFNLSHKINIKPKILVTSIISDGSITNIDTVGKIQYKDYIYQNLTEEELVQAWDKFIFSHCNPYAPIDSSERIKTAIYRFFKETYDIEKYDPQVQTIVLSKENIDEIISVINKAKEEYKHFMMTKLQSSPKEIITNQKWEVPTRLNYNNQHNKNDFIKSIMKPFYSNKLSNPEIMFINKLESSVKVKWWFKNGESNEKYFGILTTDEHTFYPDFIIQFMDGSIGIFDTKGGMTAESAKERAEGLQQYLKKEKEIGKNVCGGIVIEKNGTWWYNDKEQYEYNKNDLSSWKTLDL